jgi:hypothetical protein
MTVTWKTWTYSELADMAERQYRAYKGDDTIYRAELLQRWTALMLKALDEN